MEACQPDGHDTLKLDIRQQNSTFDAANVLNGFPEVLSIQFIVKEWIGQWGIVFNHRFINGLCSVICGAFGYVIYYKLAQARLFTIKKSTIGCCRVGP